MPATLPWPKIAQTPPKTGTALPSISVILAGQEAGQRLCHPSGRIVLLMVVFLRSSMPRLLMLLYGHARQGHASVS